MNEDWNIQYQINEKDQLVFVSENWDAFALANEGHNILSQHVLHRSIWSFISDPTTLEIYKHVLSIIRRGQSLRFSFRCDSPAYRRLLEMNIVQGENSTVMFNTRTLSVESRHPPAILETHELHSGKFLRMCGWCKKINIGNRWVEVEDAIEQLRLFDDSMLPTITHGICCSCHDKMRLLIES